MLFALDGNIDSLPEDLLLQTEDMKNDSMGRSLSPPVERLDGKVDLWAPRYLCVGKPLVDLTNCTDNLTIKLSDFGGGR